MNYPCVLDIFSSPILSVTKCVKPLLNCHFFLHIESKVREVSSLSMAELILRNIFYLSSKKLCNHLGISKRLASSHVIKSVIDHKADFPHSAYKRQSPITQSSLALSVL